MDLPWAGWIRGVALPGWKLIGFDRIRGLYHERLTFQGTPVSGLASRLMVQARQISTYCRASLDGMHDDASDALECLDRVKRLYRSPDDQPGWVFSLAPDGTPAGTHRDLYAHAFVLYAYGWAYRLNADPAYLAIARETTKDIHRIFGNVHGGFLDAMPPTGMLRLQDPHMHLLEAFLVLFDVSGDVFYLDEATALVRLALDKLIHPLSGALLEEFSHDWSVLEVAGSNRVEPGHLFEWVWLFGEYLRLYPASSDAERVSIAADRMFELGLKHGVKSDVVRDAILDDGRALEDGARIWPQTELCRLLRTRNTHPDIVSGLTREFFAAFIPDLASPLWIDRVDAQGRSTAADVPASSLYHIYGAAREFRTTRTA